VKKSFLLVGVALLGFGVAVVAVILGDRPASSSPSSSAPGAAAPFASYVAGAGIAETGRGNVAVGTAVFGVVAELYVRVGDQVKAGDPLFKIDDRDLQARRAVARAGVEEAEARLAKPAHRLEFLARLQHKDNSAVSAQLLSDARDDVRAAQSALASAHAAEAQIRIDIERCLVRAPAAGRILQVNTRVGEYVEGGGKAGPLLLLGDDSRIYLRVDVDESDAWRVRPEAPARATVRGNPRLVTALRFEYVEPYVAPKTSMTGQSTERSDVRVLQVVYSFERGKLPVYLGQQMDVFIAAPPVPPGAAARTP
jgi:multidrug efflux pump subunit AcrA (membrane-fusion protein)